MENVSNEIVEVIRETIKLEINGRSFFEHAGKMTHSELGKKMFRKLAQDEIGHLDTFSKLFSSVIGEEEWKKFVQEEELNSKSSVIEELAATTDKEERAGELDALRIGMELERKAIDFFEKSAKQVSDPVAREIFDKIGEEERLHYDLLQAEYDHITQTGYWFDIAEFRMDGKF